MKSQSLLYIIFSLIFISGCAASKQKTGKTLHPDGHMYRFQLPEQEMEIDPTKGGRINTLKFGSSDFLTDSSVNSLNWGSTLWFSPQSNWKWPPSPQIDSMKYTVLSDKTELVMRSQIDVKTGMFVTKAFSASAKDTSYTLKYTITNQSGQAQKVAPWEVSRVKTGGLAFFPYGDGERRGGLIPYTTETNGISWFQYDTNRLPAKGDRQLYSDGKEGWLANANDGFILIKKFEDIPFEKNAPKEGEIEWYASPVVPGKSYVEIEHQGAYEELQPGASMTWEVKWYFRRLPAGVVAEAGNQKLLRYVRNIVK